MTSIICMSGESKTIKISDFFGIRGNEMSIEVWHICLRQRNYSVSYSNQELNTVSTCESLKKPQSKEEPS